MPFDVAPNGADRLLDCRSYKDFAPTELVSRPFAHSPIRSFARLLVCSFARLLVCSFARLPIGAR
jgi:hypothetical protein